MQSGCTAPTASADDCQDAGHTRDIPLPHFVRPTHFSRCPLGNSVLVSLLVRKRQSHGEITLGHIRTLVWQVMLKLKLFVNTG